MLDPYMRAPAPIAGWGYAAPPAAWAAGDILVVPIHGTHLPPVCPKSGEPTQDTLLVKLQWQPQWVYLLLFTGVLPFAIVSLITQKRAAILFPMSRRFIERRRNGFIVGLGGFFLFLAMLIGGVALGLDFLSILSPVVFLGSLIYMVVTVNLFKVVKISDQFALLRGVHPSYLQHFAQGPLPNL